MSIPSLFARNKKLARAVAGGCVALAAGGIVLLHAPGRGALARSPSGASVRHTSGPGGAPRVEFQGPWLHGRTALTQGAVQAGGTRSVFAEIRVSADRRAVERVAGPVAMAVVLDVSGSMTGEKIEQARGSVLQLVERMRDEDQIALVTYSDAARVVQPLAPLREVRARLRTVIPTIGIEGGTNIPAGLALGAGALAGAGTGLVRRVVLISDGQDGSGQALEGVAGTVRARADEGVTLSSLGIGADFDERFMTRMADAGRGNYEFLRRGAELAGFLSRELQQASSTTVERAFAEVTLPSGWRIAHAYGTEPSGTAGTVRLPIGALFAGDERRVVLDLAVDAGAAGLAGTLATRVGYRVVPEQRDVALDAGRLALRVVDTDESAQATRDLSLFAEAQSTALAAAQVTAVNAWREGNVELARQIATANAARLQAVNHGVGSAALAAQAAEYARDSVAFGTLSARSDDGRAYGLRSGASNRARQWRGSGSN